MLQSTERQAQQPYVHRTEWSQPLDSYARPTQLIRDFVPTRERLREAATVVGLRQDSQSQRELSLAESLYDLTAQLCQRVCGMFTLVGSTAVVAGAGILVGSAAASTNIGVAIGSAFLVAGAAITLPAWQLAKHFHESRIG